MSLALVSMVELRLEIGVPRSVPEDVQTLLDVVIAEHVLECGVHTGLIGDLGVVRAALVNDLQRHAVLDGLAHRVFVDVVAEHLLGLVDRRARVADLGGVGQALVEVGPKQFVLRTVGLVGHDEDAGAGVQLRERLGQVRLPELVDHRHHQVGGVGPEQFLERS